MTPVEVNPESEIYSARSLAGRAGSATGSESCERLSLVQRPGPTTSDDYDAARETLSEFVARVLNQLSLSAWLPSAALVLLAAFILTTGSTLDEHRHYGALETVTASLRALSGVDLGGVILLGTAVVVLTMLTQAFSFEAIRVLEGYWGTARQMEWLAQRRADSHRRRVRRLEERAANLKTKSWPSVIAQLSAEETRAVALGSQPEITPPILEALGAWVLHGESPTEDQVEIVNSIPWQDHLPGDERRRLVNIERRLNDFPPSPLIMPTRLGNVLRSFEDQTGHVPVESLVQDVFDLLPFSLRVEHDEQRTRLDLYASMIVVLALATLLAVIRFSGHTGFELAAALVGVVGVVASYQAAIASARYYGTLLLRIALFAEPTPSG